MNCFSIIIPHKDTPSLLQRCLESVPNRKDTEIIVIDDNSSPSSILLLQQLEQSFPKVRWIYTTEGRGAGYARNQGLMIATGKWLIFADSDDFFPTDFNKILDKYSNDTYTDIVFFNALSIDENGNYKPNEVNYYIKRYLNKRFLALHLLKYQVWAPWSRMIKRNIAIDHSILFDEIAIGNDAWFVLNCTSYAKSFAIEDKICYFYYQPTGGSQTSKKYTQSNIVNLLRLRLRINRFYNKIRYPFRWPISSKIKIKSLSQEQQREIKNLYREYNYSVLKECYARFSQLVLKAISHFL